MKKAVALLTSIIFIALSLIQSSCNIGCGANTPNRYWANRLDLRAYKLPENTNNRITENNDSVFFNELFFQLHFDGERFRASVYDFNIIPSAYACKPSPPISTEIIDSIVITGDADYDDLHPKGSNLNELFEVQSAGRYNIDAFIKQKSTVNDFDLYLIQAPKEETKISFQVQVYFQGRLYKYLSKTTSPIIVKPI